MSAPDFSDEPLSKEARAAALKAQFKKGSTPPRPVPGTPPSSGSFAPPTLAPTGPTKRKRKSILQFEITPKKIKPELVMNFARQSSSFVRAGIPILDAIEVIRGDATNKKFIEVMDDLALRIRGGASLGDAVAIHRNAFPKFFSSMVQSAELTGRLDDVLDQVAQYMDRDLETRRKVKSALSYPSVIGVMSIVVVIVLSVFVLPRFKTFFDGFNAKLPLATRMLLGFTNFTANYGKYIALGILALPVLYTITMRSEAWRFRRDALLLKIPKAGKLIHLAIIERFCRILSVMVQAGVPLTDAIDVAADSAASRPFKRELAGIREQMIRGSGLAAPVAASKMFPAAARQMIRVGEATGTLDEQLASSARYYGRELEYKLKRFTDLFEPAMIIFMGGAVGFVAIALVSAMYGIFNQVDI